MKARELYRDIARERMNTLGPIYQTTAHGHRILNLMRWPTCWSYCARTLKKILISGGIKSAIWKKEVRTPGNEAETWDSSPTSLGPVHLDIKQDSSSIWGCQTPTPINASTGGVFETSPCEYFHDISSISKSIDNRALLYICVFIYYSRTDRRTPWSWTMFQSHSQKALGTSCFFRGGRGRGLLCSSFLRQWQC